MILKLPSFVKIYMKCFIQLLIFSLIKYLIEYFSGRKIRMAQILTPVFCPSFLFVVFVTAQRLSYPGVFAGILHSMSLSPLMYFYAKLVIASIAPAVLVLQMCEMVGKK